MRQIGISMAIVLLLLAANPAGASLITIGTATYQGSNYNLIRDDDNNGNSIVWLDYSSSPSSWTDQNSWASELSSSLSLNFDGYSVDWIDDSWRLPTAVDGTIPLEYMPDWFYDGTGTIGWNITNSEFGHLYYDELGNKGYYDKEGNLQDDWGLQETGDFNELKKANYWLGTEYSDNPDAAFYFITNGVLYTGYKEYGEYVPGQGNVYHDVLFHGIAVREAEVSPVPEPASLLLLASGLAGIGVYRKRFRRLEPQRDRHG